MYLRSTRFPNNALSCNPSRTRWNVERWIQIRSHQAMTPETRNFIFHLLLCVQAPLRSTFCKCTCPFSFTCSCAIKKGFVCCAVETWFDIEITKRKCLPTNKLLVACGDHGAQKLTGTVSRYEKLRYTWRGTISRNRNGNVYNSTEFFSYHGQMAFLPRKPWHLLFHLNRLWSKSTPLTNL